GQHQAKHAGGENGQQRVEAAEALPGREVVRGIQHHQQTDAENQRGEHRTQPVETEREIEAELREPRQAEEEPLAGENRGHEGREQRQRGHHGTRRDPGGRGAGTAAAVDGDHERHGDEEREDGSRHGECAQLGLSATTVTTARISVSRSLSSITSGGIRYTTLPNGRTQTPASTKRARSTSASPPRSSSTTPIAPFVRTSRTPGSARHAASPS